MHWVRDDGGRSAAGFSGSAGDCVTRAVAIATNKPYFEVYQEIQACAGTERPRKTGRRSSPRTGVSKPTTRRYLESLGWVWTPTMHIGSGCRVHLADGELPMGRLIVSVSKHVVAVIDGVIHDTHDPQRSIAVCRTFPGWETAELKPGEHRNQNGIFHVSRRCVYGYWQNGTAA